MSLSSQTHTMAAVAQLSLLWLVPFHHNKKARTLSCAPESLPKGTGESPNVASDKNKGPRGPDIARSWFWCGRGCMGEICYCSLNCAQSNGTYFLVNKKHQYRVNGRLVWHSEELQVGSSPCLAEPGKVLRMHLRKANPLLSTTKQSIEWSLRHLSNVSVFSIFRAAGQYRRNSAHHW